MLLASHVAESFRDSEVPQPNCGVSLGEADLRGGLQREVSTKHGLSVLTLATVATSSTAANAQCRNSAVLVTAYTCMRSLSF